MKTPEPSVNQQTFVTDIAQRSGFPVPISPAARLPRRTALKAIAIGAVTIFTGNIALSQIKLRVRRSLTGMALNDPDLSTYRDFVGIMKKKDQSKPDSWLGFANQHGSLSTGTYKFCPHGDWYFLPWHRAYVLMYETAAQVLTGNKDFAMPYWNWTEMRTYPQAFADTTYQGHRNPLHVANRNSLTGTHALTDSIVGQTQVIDKIYEETVFEAFGTSRNPKQKDTDPKWVPAGGGSQGILERTPHNLVHNNIGAFMPSPASPRDPIFFMHHGNIDRIWAHWNALGRKNSKDPLWLNMKFTDNYLHADGKPYSSSVHEMLDINALGYTYDFLPQPDGKSSDPTRESRLLSVLHSDMGAPVEGVQRLGGAMKAAATVTGPLNQRLMLADNTMKSVVAPAADGRTPEVFALISDIVIGENVRGIRVFVNHKDLSLDIEDTDPHYVTTLAFLDHKAGAHAGGDHAEGAHKAPPCAIVNLTHTLQRLQGFKRLSGDEITVQLIPIPASGVVLENVGTVVPASIEIIVL